MGGPGLNTTDPLAKSVHGTNPQNLLERITRNKIYDSLFWKEQCFGLDAANLVDKAEQLKFAAGSFGGAMKPSNFLCLILKMLQICPEDDIVFSLIRADHLKYVRLLGAFYLRLTGRPADIYTFLEPLLNDYRKINTRHHDGTWIEGATVDSIVDDLLTKDYYFQIALPRLPKRENLVEAGYLEGERERVLDEFDTVGKIEERLKELGAAAVEELLVEEKDGGGGDGAAAEKSIHPEGSDEYWNEQRAKLGLAPLNNSSSGKKDEKSKKRKNENEGDNIEKKAAKKKKKEPKVKEKKKGSLFKSSVELPKAINESSQNEEGDGKGPKEGSDEYWNLERAKLGLKPLKK